MTDPRPVPALAELLDDLRQVEANCRSEYWEYSADVVRNTRDRLAALERLMPRARAAFGFMVDKNRVCIACGYHDDHAVTCGGGVLRDLLALRGDLSTGSRT